MRLVSSRAHEDSYGIRSALEPNWMGGELYGSTEPILREPIMRGKICMQSLGTTSTGTTAKSTICYSAVMMVL